MESFVTWLASYPKTGSTWVRAMVNAYFYGEHFHPNRMDLCPGEPCRAIYAGLWTRDHKWDCYDWACMRNVALQQQHSMFAVPDEAYLIKTHSANLMVHDINLISNVYTKRAIYVARDPRDVLVSCAKYFRNSYEDMWKKMQDDEFFLGGADRPAMWQLCSSYAMHLRSWLNTPTTFPVMRVLYEDMIEDPGRELKRVLEFIEIEPDEELVELAVKLTTFEQLREAEDRHGFRENAPVMLNNEDVKGKPEKFFRVGKTGQWRTELSKELAEDVMRVLAPLEHLWGKPKPESQAA